MSGLREAIEAVGTAIASMASAVAAKSFPTSIAVKGADGSATSTDNPLPVAVSGSIVSQSGGQFFEGIRDDIALIFSRDHGEDSITHLVDVSPSPHPVTHDATEGRAVFSIDATPGAVCYHESDKTAIYEPGHMILGGQTIEISDLPTGDGKIEWGFGENNGSGAILNAIGMGVDATGTYVFRKKAGAYAEKVYSTSWDNPLVGFDILKNNIMGPGFEWYGVASPEFFIADANGSPQRVHVLQTAGQITGTTIPEPQLPQFVRIQGDSTTGQALSVASGCWRGGTLTNKVVLTGQQPDRDYVDLKADGTAFMTDTPLSAAGTYTSAWQDSDGWSSIEIFVATDQVSGTDGIELQFTDDVQAVTPTVRGSERFTFTASEVSSGHLIVRRGTALDGFRVVYTNGGTPQGDFFLSATLRVAPAGAALNSLESDIDQTSIAAMMRGAIFAQNDGGTYGLIERSDLGGFRVSIKEHEADTPIKALTNWQTNQANVGTSAAQIIGSPLSGRKTVAIKALAANNAKVYIGLNGVTTGSGYELNSSEAIIMEIDDSAPGIYAIAASGTQRVCWAEVA